MTIVALVTGILAVLLLLNTCRLNKKIDEQGSQITQEQLNSQELRETINTKNQVIYEQTSIITNSQKAISSLTDTIFNLKDKDKRNRDVIAYYQGRTITKLDSVLVPYLDSNALHHFSDSVLAACADVIQYIGDSTVKVGTKAHNKNPHYDIAATVARGGIFIDSLSIPDTLNLLFREHKGSLFRKRKIEILYFHSNPLIQTTGANSVFYIPKKKNWLAKALILGAGIFIGTKL